MAVALGIPLSLCARMLFEKRGKERQSRLIVYSLGSAILPILYYFFFLKDLNMVSVTRYIGISLALYLAFIFIPYLGDRKNFEIYVLKLFTGFLVTYVYSAILYAGLSAILFTTNKLLGVPMESEIYVYTFLTVALIFAPAYFLAQVPKSKEDLSPMEYSKVFKVLLMYILMPLLSVYTFILYLYFGKIIVTMQWPVGLVSHLVLWYSILLTIVLFFIHPMRNENKWIKGFSQWAPLMVLPILLMMFVSMGIRIKAYGVTENRYYVFVLGLWVLGIMIYYAITKSKKNIVLLVSLSIVLLLSVLGPISSYSIANHSQNKRFSTVLKENSMIEGNHIKPASHNISKADKEQISGILHYFETQHDLKGIKYLPQDFKIENMEDIFGFAYTHPTSPVENEYFYLMIEENHKLFEISSYDYLYRFNSYLNKSQINDEVIDVILQSDSNSIIVGYEGIEIYQKDLTPYINKLYETYGLPQGTEAIPSEEMTIIDENDRLKVKLIFHNIEGQKEDSQKIKIENMDVNILIKIK